MADLTQTITNTLEVYGGGPTTKWDDATWDVSVWDEGGVDIIHLIGKFLTGSLTLSDLLAGKTIGKTYSDSLSLTDETSEEQLFDNQGWNYLFLKPSIDAEDRVADTWIEATEPSASFTCVAAATDSWTEV